MCESVSIVPPDFDETMNSVVLEVDRRARARARRPGRSSRARAGAGRPGISPKERRITSGPRLEPPMPSSTASVKPSALTCVDERVAASAACSSIFSLIVSQPSRFADLGHAGAAPERLVLAARSAAPRPPSGACLTRSIERGLELVRDRGRDRRRAAGDDRPRASARRPRSACRTARRTSRCPSRSSLLGHVAHVDAGARRAPRARRVGSWSAVAPVTSSCSAQASSVGIGIVLTVCGRDQRVDVLGLRVVRVLDAGRGPQRALHRGAGVAQAREALARGRAP